MNINLISNITNEQRLKKVTIDTGNIYIIEAIGLNGTWHLADSSIDNAVVAKRLVDWGISSDIESAISLMNQGCDENASSDI